MREILFRGKGTSGYCAGEWVYGYYCYDFWGKKDHGILPVDKNCGGYCEVTPETVGQYTGLKDKNGKRIFEGDIVAHHVQGDILVNYGPVIWDDSNGKWCQQLNTMHPDFSLFNTKAFEVIGNIHDNPELLGGADNG